MEERLYLILDSKGTPLANAVLDLPVGHDLLHLSAQHLELKDLGAGR